MKTVGDNVYVHITAISELPEELQVKVERICNFFRKRSARTFQVIKVNKKVDRVSLLCYPKFWNQNFPELTESWTIDYFPDGSYQTQHRKYNKDNPPILHRRELFIKSNDRRRHSMKKITHICEKAGCFEDTKRIGYKKHWQQVLREKGVQL